MSSCGPTAKQTLPPISQLGLHLSQHSSQQSYQRHDPFISSRTNPSSSERLNFPHENSSNKPPQQPRPYDRMDSSASVSGGAATSSVRHRNLLDERYNEEFDLLRRSSSNSTPTRPSSSTSTSFSTNPDDWNCESKESGRGGMKRQAEEDVQRKRKNHAQAEKDRRELSNYYVRNIKTLTFPRCNKGITSRTPHNKDEEAKNEILRHSEAFTMALMHRMNRLEHEIACYVASRQDSVVSHDDHSSCEGFKERQVGLSFQAASLARGPTACTNQPATCTTPMPSAAHRLHDANFDRSSMKAYVECFETQACGTWLEEVLDDAAAIAHKRNESLKRAVNAARSRNESLTKDLLDRELD